MTAASLLVDQCVSARSQWCAFKVATLPGIAVVLDQVLDAMRLCDVPESACFSVRLAVDEAVVNAIKHGHGGDTSKHVTVRYKVDEEQIEVEVEDQGPGFDAADIPDPCAA